MSSSPSKEMKVKQPVLSKKANIVYKRCLEILEFLALSHSLCQSKEIEADELGILEDSPAEEVIYLVKGLGQCNLLIECLEEKTACMGLDDAPLDDKLLPIVSDIIYCCYKSENIDLKKSEFVFINAMTQDKKETPFLNVLYEYREAIVATLEKLIKEPGPWSSISIMDVLKDDLDNLKLPKREDLEEASLAGGFFEVFEYTASFVESIRIFMPLFFTQHQLELEGWIAAVCGSYNFSEGWSKKIPQSQLLSSCISDYTDFLAELDNVLKSVLNGSTNYLKMTSLPKPKTLKMSLDCPANKKFQN